MTSKIERLQSYEPSEIVVLDTETTGLASGGNDEILSVSMTDGDGNVLLDEMYKPAHRKRWPKAESINGISPAMVADKQPISADVPRIESILKKAKLIVGYNLEFDLDFLEAAGVEMPRRAKIDVMKEFARTHGEYDSYHEDWRWYKLVDVAEYYDYGFEPHSSLEDTKATAFCFRSLLEDPWYGEPRRKPHKVVDEYGEEYLDYGDDEDRVWYPSSRMMLESDSIKQAEIPAKPSEIDSDAINQNSMTETPSKSYKAGKKALRVLGVVILAIAALMVFAGQFAMAIFLLVLGAAFIVGGRK